MLTFLDYSTLLSNSYVWFEFILNLAIKGTLILGVALIVSFLWKHASASARHLILCLSIIGLLLLPLLSFMLPAWELSFLKSVSPQNTLSTLPDEEVGSSIQIENQDETVKLPLKLHWPVGLMLLWTVGTAGILIRLLAGLFGRWWMLRKASVIDDKHLQRLFSAYAKKLDISRKIRLLQSSQVMVPLTWGYFHPTILLPETVKSWSDKRKVYVLLHEFAHIKRGDALTSFIAQVASIIHWFNPLFWSVLRQFYIEREHASDNVVLTAGTKASDYAHHLLEIARSLTAIRWPSPVEVAMAQKSYLEGRLLSILNNKEHRNPLKWSTIILIGFLTLTFMLPLASIQPWAKSETEQNIELTAEEIIKKIHSEYNKAFESQDIDRMLSFFSKCYFDQIDKNNKIAIDKWKKDTFKKYFYKKKKTIINSNVLGIKKNGDQYILHEKFSISGIDYKGSEKYYCKNSKKLLVFEKEDGKWKISYIEYKELKK